MGSLNYLQMQPNWVPIPEQPLYTPRKVKIITIGAGFGGLTLEHKIQHEMKMEDYVEHQIYEKNSAVGGTWFENNYPGAACDVPAHIYTFAFQPNPNWSQFYVGAPEIKKYIEETSEKWNLAKNVSFNSKVVEARWNEAKGKWVIKVEKNGKMFTDEADIFVSAAGFLNKWTWPSIKGLHSFEGKLMHSAGWDDDYDYTNQRVGVVGNGSSALQIVPTMHKKLGTGHLYNFIRQSTWVAKMINNEWTKDGKNFYYSEEEKRSYRESPEKLLKLRKELEGEFNKFFWILLNAAPAQEHYREALTELMRERLGGDEELCSKIIPEYGVGCRRLSPGEGYLECLTEKNVTPVFGQIEEVTPKGVLINGEEIELDVLVCATGFDVGYTPTWKHIGKQGADLHEMWKDVPEGYLGICAPQMPNYFMFMGPNSPVGHGPVLSMMNVAARWMCKWVKKMATEDIKSIIPKQGAIDDYNVYTQEFMKRMVYMTGCRSWYNKERENGVVTAANPGSSLHYITLMQDIRPEDFELQYNSPNRFRFFGDGFAQVEKEENGDMSWYLTC